MTVCKVGISDISAYCCAYPIWADMIVRCYGDRYKTGAYADVTVCTSWLTASNFKRWYDKNYVLLWQLDKDFKIVGNKVYSPDTCLYLPRQLNSLFTGGWKRETPRGVVDKGNCYRALVNIEGRPKRFGKYYTIEEARCRYVKEKVNESERILNTFKSQLSPETYTIILNNLEGLACAQTL